jgi:transformer-2 protein
VAGQEKKKKKKLTRTYLVSQHQQIVLDYNNPSSQRHTQLKSPPLHTSRIRQTMSLPTLLNPQTPKLHVPLSLKFPSFKTLKIPTKIHSFSPSSQSQFPIRNDSFEDQDHAIGDCIVFEEGIFEDPYLENNSNAIEDSKLRSVQKKIKRVVPKIEEENLVPENWREVQAEINIGKKERRKIAQELEYNKKFERKRKGLVPIRNVNLEEYQAFREAKLAQLKPLVLDYPQNIKEEEEEEDEVREIVSERVKGKNPRWAVYGRGLDDVREFFNGEGYEPGEQKSEGNCFSISSF